jgi:hypothetical protein
VIGSSHSTPAHRLTDVPEVRAGLALGFLFVLTPLGQRLDVSVDLALTITVVAAVAAGLPGRLAVLVAGCGWALTTGFLVNSEGALTFGDRDLVHLATVVGAAAAVSTLRRTWATRHALALARHPDQHSSVDALHA